MMDPHNPQRILMTTDAVGGVWTFTCDLALEFQKQGAEIALATMGPRADNAQRAQLSSLGNVTLFESEYALEWMEHPWGGVERAGEWLRETADAFRPDIIHLNGYSHAALPWHVPVVVTAHSCVCSWWRALKGSPPPPCWQEYRARVRAGLAAADLVVAPTRAMRDTLAQNYGVDFKCIVIPNGRDPRLFLEWDKEERIFASGRVWDEAKNLVLLDRVAPQIPWPIEIAGSCARDDGGKVELRHARALGHVAPEKLREHLASASIFAAPSRYEPFGLAALEAGLSGCALVLGDIASLREVWGDAALFVSPNDPGEIAAVLNGLARDGTLRERMAGRARRRAREFSAAKMGHAYLTAYRECLRRSFAEAAA